MSTAAAGTPERSGETARVAVAAHARAATLVAMAISAIGAVGPVSGPIHVTASQAAATGGRAIATRTPLRSHSGVGEGRVQEIRIVNNPDKLRAANRALHHSDGETA